MANEDKFTEKIISSVLEILKEKHKWNEELVNEITKLKDSNSLNDSSALVDVFNQAVAMMEAKTND